MTFDLPWTVFGMLARRAADAVATQWFGAAGPAAVSAIVQFAKPVDPFDQPSFVAPFIGLPALLASLLGLGLLLARVYGITIDFAQFRAA